jgi:hypothetical protein
VWSFDVIAGLPWLQIIKALAPVATAVIAFLALKNWKRQDNAKRQADFLDQLTEAVHDFIGTMPTPVTLVQMIKIGMASHIPTEEPKDGDPMVAGAIEYIERRGNEDAKRLLEALETSRPFQTRIRALAVKGNVFRFRDYETCKNAVTMLSWQFDRMQALAAFIRSSSWYWQNDEIITQLKKIMALDADDIRTQIGSYNAAIITYVSDRYSSLFD